MTSAYRARLAALAVLALCIAVLGACGTGAPDVSPLPTPGTRSPASSDAAKLLQDVIADPEQYAGREITVEGVLEARGQMPNARFFLRAPAGELLEVSAWAPLDVIQPPAGGDAPETMSSYVGKTLRLTGILDNGPQGVILQVSAAED